MAHEIQYFLGVQELELLFNIFHPVVKNFERREIILKKSVKEERFCFLLSGTAYLEVENEYNSKQILDYFIKGQFFCHNMLIRPNNGNCYVIAKQPCSIAYIDPLEIEKYRQTHKDSPLSHLPAFIFQSMIFVSQQHCHILQQKTIRNKILTFLYFQARYQSSFTVRLPIPYSDLADYLAVDRSSMMKELSRMCSDGIIEKKAHHIKLLT